MAIGALHPQEAIGGVADPGGQNLVPEHGIDHSALPIARPVGRRHWLSVRPPHLHLGLSQWSYRPGSPRHSSAQTGREGALSLWKWTDRRLSCPVRCSWLITANQHARHSHGVESTQCRLCP